MANFWQKLFGRNQNAVENEQEKFEKEVEKEVAREAKRETGLKYLRTIQNLKDARYRNNLANWEPGGSSRFNETIDNRIKEMFAYSNAIMQNIHGQADIYSLNGPDYSIDSIIDSINSLNKLCSDYGIEKIFDINRRLNPDFANDRKLAVDMIVDLSLKVNPSDRQREAMKSLDDIYNLTAHIGRSDYFHTVDEDITRAILARVKEDKDKQVFDPDYVTKISLLLEAHEKDPDANYLTDNGLNERFADIGEAYNNIFDPPGSNQKDSLLQTINDINKDCKKHGLEPMFDVDTSHRKSESAFEACFQFTKEFYMNEQQRNTFKNFDDMCTVTWRLEAPENFSTEYIRQKEIIKNKAIGDRYTNMSYEQKLVCLYESSWNITSDNTKGLQRLEESFDAIKDYYNTHTASPIEKTRKFWSEKKENEKEQTDQLVKSINIINACCQYVGIPKMFDVDRLSSREWADRQTARDCCLSFAKEMYKDEIEIEAIHDLDDAHKITEQLGTPDGFGRVPFSLALKDYEKTFDKENPDAFNTNIQYREATHDDFDGKPLPLCKFLLNQEVNSVDSMSKNLTSLQYAMDSREIGWKALDDDSTSVRNSFNAIATYYDKKIHGTYEPADENELEKAVQNINAKCEQLGVEKIFDNSSVGRIHDTTFHFCSKFYMNDRQKEVFKSYEDVNDRYCCKQVNHSLKDLYMSAREYQPHPQAQNQVATLDNVLQGLKNECRAEQTVTNDRQRYQNVGEAVDAR